MAVVACNRVESFNSIVGIEFKRIGAKQISANAAATYSAKLHLSNTSSSYSSSHP